MLRNALIALSSTLALLVTGACGSPSSNAQTPGPASPSGSAAAGPTATGQPLPELSFALLDGGQWTAASTRGRVLVVDVWATFCKPCLKAFPKLERWTTAYPGVAVVGISVDEEDEAVREFLATTPASFTIARDPTLSVRDGPLGITKLPTLLIVDREGVVRFRGDEMSVEDYDRAETVLAELMAQ